MEEEVKTTKARQGRLGRPVLLVLIASLILVCFVWFGTEWYGSAISEDATITEQQ